MKVAILITLLAFMYSDSINAIGNDGKDRLVYIVLEKDHCLLKPVIMSCIAGAAFVLFVYTVVLPLWEGLPCESLKQNENPVQE